MKKVLKEHLPKQSATPKIDPKLLKKVASKIVKNPQKIPLLYMLNDLTWVKVECGRIIVILANKKLCLLCKGAASLKNFDWLGKIVVSMITDFWQKMPKCKNFIYIL